MKSTNFDITQKSQIIDKDNISNINQQNEQDLINYQNIFKIYKLLYKINIIKNK